jgi:hypothetical protein
MSNSMGASERAVPHKSHAPDGPAMAAALQELAERGTFTAAGDAAQWQREVRTDRPLPHDALPNLVAFPASA